MRRIYSTLSLAFLSIFFLQCQREVSHIGGPDTPVEVIVPEPITAALQGNIFDETGAPAAGVTVQVGSKTTTTNSKGYFRINDAPLDKKASLVIATKAGYFKGYRTFSATSGANQVIIKLIKKVAIGTIDAAAGGKVAMSNGSKIALPANGVVNASTTAAYTGTVNVYAAYIDPMAADIDQIVPGSFMANDKDGNRVSMVSYGMLAVELESAAGEKLQIKSGATATLTTAITSSVQASAPATIALWSVDEATGLWKEDGTATKSGNVYVGQVKHFSFWNCDFGLPAVTLSLTLKNAAGLPIVHGVVRIKRTITSSMTYGYTDSLGQVSGLVPKNEPLVLEVLDQCNTPFFSQSIGPFSQNTNIGIVTISNTGAAVITIKGKLTNCSGAVVTSGYAMVSIGNYTHYAIANATGDFETTFISCSSSPTTYSVVGVDNATQQQNISATSGALTLPITNTGNISVCGTSSAQYINYILDGTNYSVTNAATDSLVAYTNLLGNTQPITYINASNSVANNITNRMTFSFNSPTTTAGTYPMNTLSVQGFSQGNVLTQPFNVIVTNFAQTVSEFYEGNFSGQFKDNANVNHTISASFRVRRSF